MQWYESCVILNYEYNQKCLDEGSTYLKLYLLYSDMHMIVHDA